MMLILLSGQRTQTLTLLDMNDITIKDSSFFMDFELLLLLFYYYYIKAVLRKYLEMTKDKRGQESRLLISFQKPFKAVTVDTLSRWVKATMSQAGIDID